MDRTSKIGLIVCFALLLGIQFAVDKFYPVKPGKPAAPASASASTNAASATPSMDHPAVMKSPTGDAGLPPTPPTPTVEETFSTLENDAMKITFTSAGAAIKNVELKLQKADNGGNIILNEDAHSNVLALTGWPGADTANFTAKEEPGSATTFTTDLPNGLHWERKYIFGAAPDRDSGLSGFLRVTFHKLARHLGHTEVKPEVYTLDVTDTLTNSGAADITLPAYSLSVGRAEPLYLTPDANGARVANPSNGQYLGSGWLASNYHITQLNEFNAASRLWIFPLHGPRDRFPSTDVDNAPLRWLGVENQFYTLLLTPDTDRSITHAEFQTYNKRDSNGYISLATSDVPDIEAAAFFPDVRVPAGQSVSVTYDLYAGPKDFNRLDALGRDQGDLMHYDGFLPFSLLIVPMLTVLHFWYLIFNNYGVAIILLTLMIKAITWPLQSFANRSGKRMQALAPKIKEIQAKYKEQPEKLQSETFALYKDYGVNPFGGCVPALIQMPVFFSLYFMLQNAVELRGQSFLWVHDLTKPDTIFTLPTAFLGVSSIHLLPILVTALTMVMMRMTPQIGDPQQAKIAQFMPLVFLFVFYNFAAALSLYYVINNFVSIIQIYRNLKKPMPELKRVPKKKPGDK
jgi:YidC/Oxa1 family membrane protein insertase